MTIKNKMIGRRYDGGRSPLGGKTELPEYDANVLAAPEPRGGVLDTSEPFNLAQPLSWSKREQSVYDSILRGRREVRTAQDTWVEAKLREWGTPLEQVLSWPEAKRRKTCNKIVREAQRIKDERYNDVLAQLLSEPPDPTVPGGRRETTHLEVQYRGGVMREMLTLGETDAARKERADLHVALRPWAAGELKLEHPQGSSFHHLVDYDKRTAFGMYASLATRDLAPQIFVVEMDWARTFAGYDLSDGEAPLPFPFCLFEFRISGVRVLTFCNEDSMYCVYGRNGVWVCDDYGYDPRSGKRMQLDSRVDAIEFPRVAKLVRDNIRVATIMVDAQIAEVGVPRQPGDGLVKKRLREGKPPPRAHYVIDLKHRKRYASSGLVAPGASGIHMRGHLRRGTWVHYDDPDSGDVQYADAGGFWHSRTWRRWHFAGDLNNMIEKEYRL